MKELREVHAVGICKAKSSVLAAAGRRYCETCGFQLLDTPMRRSSRCPCVCLLQYKPLGCAIGSCYYNGPM